MLDLDGDGHAELLRQSFGGGYWTTSIYEARDARWEAVRGQHGDRAYPLFTRFTIRPNRQPTSPPPGDEPTEDDLSNAIDRRVPAKILKHVRWADTRRSHNPTLYFSNGHKCWMVGWYSTAVVVIDGPGRRSIATLGSPAVARKLLDEMARRGIPVRVAGSRRRTYVYEEEAVDVTEWCSVETIWATEPP